MGFLYLKAIHIVFVVSWFAALFYIVRLFIYATEAQNREEVVKQALTEQLTMMQRRLWYIIGWPAMIGTLVFGTWMYFLNLEYYFSQPWMWLKIIAVGLLVVYHFECQHLLSQQKKGIFRMGSFKLRLFNELATVLLVAIVFLVVIKSEDGLLWGTLGLLGFAGMLILGVTIYKRRRRKEKEEKPDGSINFNDPKSF